MMKTAINLLSVIPMRKEAAHRSEMVSQLLFGEFVEILHEDKDFMRVRCLYDDYEGWIQSNQLNLIEQLISTDTYIVDWSQQVLVNGLKVHAPMCSPVYLSKEHLSQLGNHAIHYGQSDHHSFWGTQGKVFTKENLEFVYEKYLNTPYLWGGKSVFGTDCSGFVQQVFKMFGIQLWRDAYLQVEQGLTVAQIETAMLGDLAFFKNENGRIVHVGIVLEDNQIVHASGKVRIDTLDGLGILNNETGKRTHQLHSIKRML